MYFSMGKVRKYIFALALPTVFFIVPTWAIDNDQINCSAPTDYIEKLSKTRVLKSVERDYSCLTTFSAISTSLDEYQIINTQSEAAIEGDLSRGAWKINMSELLHKSTLATRKILLIGNGFSRVDASENCATLKKMGFVKTKILLDADSYISNTNHQRALFRVNVVTADKVLFEYFNGTVNILSTSDETTSELSALGIKNVKTLNPDYESQILDVVIYETGGGFEPVVIVGKNDPLAFMHYMPNVYQLINGVEKIEFFLRAKVGSMAQMESEPGSYFCGKR